MNKLTRREFIISMSQFSLTGVALCYLPLAQADCCRLSWWSIFRLQPARIIAGLIFDEVAPVAVRWVASGVSDLFSGHYSIYDSEAYKSLTNETLFNHPAYKAAIVTLGVADYEKHRQRQIRLLLNNAVDYNRFNLIRDYLREEKIALKTSDQEISYPIGVYRNNSTKEQVYIFLSSV